MSTYLFVSHWDFNQDLSRAQRLNRLRDEQKGPLAEKFELGDIQGLYVKEWWL